jgi:hypothetical protein
MCRLFLCDHFFDIGLFCLPSHRDSIGTLCAAQQLQTPFFWSDLKMRKNLVALTMMSAFVASGCTTVIDPFPARVVVHDPSPTRVVITNDGGGRHCPPGQAKKGRC